MLAAGLPGALTDHLLVAGQEQVRSGQFCLVAEQYWQLVPSQYGRAAALRTSSLSISEVWTAIGCSATQHMAHGGPVWGRCQYGFMQHSAPGMLCMIPLACSGAIAPGCKDEQAQGSRVAN